MVIRVCRGGLFGLVLAVLAAPVFARVWLVKPGSAIATVAEAARLAGDGDEVDIEAGDYVRDVAVWPQKRLTLRGVHGRVRLIADGAAAEGKAIWVLRDGDFRVENIEFIGARVAAKNGAGIRFEKGHLTVRNCLFRDNEMGILTNNDPTSELDVAGSEFGPNGYHDGRFHHNLYVGLIARVRVTGSYFHHALDGHLLKSRARESYILYNRLTDETGGQASYELEFPSGGRAWVMGNLIEQEAATGNKTMVSFGAEGYAWPENDLYLVHNTLLDNLPEGGQFLAVRPGGGKLVVVNNLLIGAGSLIETGVGEFGGNVRGERDALVDARSYDYRLTPASSIVGMALPEPKAIGQSLRPEYEYRHPRQIRVWSGHRLRPGAMQSDAGQRRRQTAAVR